MFLFVSSVVSLPIEVMLLTGSFEFMLVFFILRLSADTGIVGTAVTNNISDGLRASVQATAGVTMMLYTSPKLAGSECSKGTQS